MSFKKYCCLEHKIRKIFHLFLFFIKLWKFNISNLGQLTRDIFRAINA